MLPIVIKLIFKYIFEGFHNIMIVPGVTQELRATITSLFISTSAGAKRRLLDTGIHLKFLCEFVQIPPPKPPPPEMHFIPNPANTEFIYLTGLEECVNRILNLDANPPPMPMPFTCSQCSTDFTPTWKWDKTAKGM
jgi:hypothetical protein